MISISLNCCMDLRSVAPGANQTTHVHTQNEPIQAILHKATKIRGCPDFATESCL